MAQNRKLLRILSIDGGGIRGIIPGKVIVYLENRLKEIDNNPDARIADYFDLIAGTSTGGILTAAYLCPDPESPGRPKFDAGDAVDIYLSRGVDIFSRSLWQKLKSAGGLVDEKHSSKEIERAFKDYFQDIRLSDLLKPCLFTAYDVERRSAFFFTQHNALEKGLDFYLRDLVRATSAAPTYFELAGIKSLQGVFYALIDGGVFANNPAMCAYAEARKMEFEGRVNKPIASDMLFLSIGTGIADNQYMYQKAKTWGVLEWIKPVIDIMMSGVSETVDYQLRQIFDAVDRKENYLRVTPELSGASPDLDDVSEDNLDDLKRAGDIAIEMNKGTLDLFAQRLIENR